MTSKQVLKAGLNFERLEATISSIREANSEQIHYILNEVFNRCKVLKAEKVSR